MTSYKKIAIFLTVFVFLYGLFLTINSLINYNNKLDKIEKEIEGTYIIKNLKDTLIHLQKLRGYTTAYISGKKEFYNEIKTEQSAVNFYLKQTILSLKNYPTISINIKRAIKNFTIIKSSYVNYPAQYVFNYYTKIINTILDTLTMAGEKTNLTVDSDIATFHLANLNVIHIPPLTEYIGKIRGEGSKIIVSKNLTTHDIVLLAQYQNNIQNLLNNILQDFNYLFEYKKNIKKAFDNKIEKLKLELNKLFQYNNSILNNHLDININEFFNIGTSAIQNAVTIFNISDKMLKKILFDRKNRLTENRNFIILTSLFFMASFIIILYIFVKKIIEYEKELLKDKEKIEKLYYYDELTKLPNKYKMNKDLQTIKPIGILITDIKKFSIINDIYGEEIGDLVLIEYANILKKISKEQKCLLYRLDNDQFMILNTKSEHVCKLIKDKILNYFKSNPITVKKEDKIIPIELEVILAKVKLEQTNIKDYKIKADLALNYAKKQKINFIEYNKNLKLEDQIVEELNTIQMVKKAIDNDNIVPVFQKIQKTQENDTYEALVRIKHGEELITPNKFLDIIKHTSYYNDITKIMIEKSFKIFQNKKESISLNFSFLDFENEKTVEFLFKQIEKYNMQNRVIIELLETESIKNEKTILKFLKQAEIYGIKFAIDDFGSGYSNFNYLVQLKPHYLKIDASLIKNLDKDKKSYVITKHIHSFAKELNIKTIAEFVADEKIYQTAKQIGIDGFQGYYISKPTFL